MQCDIFRFKSTALTKPETNTFVFEDFPLRENKKKYRTGTYKAGTTDGHV